MRRKKGEVSIETIVIAAIALIVLIILVFVFRQQIGNAIKNMTDISGDVQKCKTGFFGSDRDCFPECGAGDGKDFTQFVPGSFTDCIKKGSGIKCCEKTGTTPATTK